MKKIDLSFLHTLSNRFFASDAIVRPRRDWVVLLVLFLVMLCGAMAFDAFLYRDIASGDMYVSVNNAELELPHINADLLNTAVNDFESRETKTAGMKPQKLVDPSL